MIATKYIEEARQINDLMGEGFQKFKKSSSTKQATRLSEINFKNAYARSNLIIRGKMLDIFDGQGFHRYEALLSREYAQMRELLFGRLRTNEFDPCNDMDCKDNANCLLNIKVSI